MNSKKNNRVRICECGQTFLVSVKFGNETNCDACYERSRQEFKEHLKTLSDEGFDEAYARLCQFALDLGIEVPDDDAPRSARQPRRRQAKPRVEEVVEEQTEPVNPEQILHRSQKRIDATAASLLEDIDM